MLIINQDHDTHYNLSTKDIITTSHSVNGLFMGWNMYGRTPKDLVLLGSFETPEFCDKVLNRITRAEAEQTEAEQMKYYTIPEEPEDEDPMFDWYNVEDIWRRMEFTMDCTIQIHPPDQREVEPFGMAVPIQLIIHENPQFSGID